MTQAIYVIGGAGVGKSTFMAALTEGLEYAPVEDIHTSTNNKRNARIRIRGHRLPGDGLYLGRMRDEYPGSDALDKVCGPVGDEWVADGDLPTYLVSEGVRFARPQFLMHLDARADLLLVHLRVDEFLQELRVLGRGGMNESWVKTSTTRMGILADNMEMAGLEVLTVDTGYDKEWDAGLARCREHLGLIS